MSSFDNTSESFFLSTISQNDVDVYFMIISAAIIVYEHAITISEEIELIWSSKTSLAILIFHMNRFSAIGFAVSSLVRVPALRGCHAVILSWERTYIAWMVSLILLLTAWAGFSALRVFAVSRQNWPIAVAVFTISLVPAAINILGAAKVAGSLYPFYFGTVCSSLGYRGIPANLGNIMSISTRICSVASDMIVLAVTWHAAYRAKIEADRVNLHVPLLDLLLRDGTCYFLFLLVLNITELTLYILEVSIDIAYLIYACQSVIVTRFCLNIRAAGRVDLGSDLGYDGYTGSIVFGRLSGSGVDGSLVGGSAFPFSSGSQIGPAVEASMDG